MLDIDIYLHKQNLLFLKNYLFQW